MLICITKCFRHKYSIYVTVDINDKINGPTLPVTCITSRMHSRSCVRMSENDSGSEVRSSMRLLVCTTRHAIGLISVATGLPEDFYVFYFNHKT